MGATGIKTDGWVDGWMDGWVDGWMDVMGCGPNTNFKRTVVSVPTVCNE
jgi:hypothetical protein